MDGINDSEAVTSKGPSDRYCFDCHHQLIDVGETSCPECGRWFDLRDKRTYYRRQPTRISCMMMKPAGWSSALFGLLCGLFILFTYSIPGGYLVYSILVIVAVPILLIALVADLMVSMFVSQRMGRPWLFEVRPVGKERVVRRSQLRWLIAPAFLFVALMIASLGLSARFSFWVSQDALLNLVESGNTAGLPGYVGLLPVESLDTDTVWLSGGGGFLDRVGFAYLPHIQSEVIERPHGVHGWRYSGDWFFVESEF